MRFDENNLRYIWLELHDIERRLSLSQGLYYQMGRVRSVREALRASGPMAGRPCP